MDNKYFFVGSIKDRKITNEYVVEANNRGEAIEKASQFYDIRTSKAILCYEVTEQIPTKFIFSSYHSRRFPTPKAVEEFYKEYEELCKKYQIKLVQGVENLEFNSFYLGQEIIEDISYLTLNSYFFSI